MISDIINNFLRFVFLILLQGIILNEMELGTWIVPYIYILFIIKLPFETPKWLVMFLAFGAGLVMDAFTNTPGLHSSSCIFLAFLRPSVLRLYSPRDGYEYGMEPSVKSMGLGWFSYYSLWLVLGFHVWFFFLEVFGFGSFFVTLGRILISSFIALLLIIISQYFTLGRRGNE